MNIRAKWLVAAAAMTGMAGAVYAQTQITSNPGDPAASSPSATGDGHWGHDGRDDDGWDHGGHDHHWRAHHRHHPHRPMMGGMMLHTLHELNLTEAQKQSVHGILANARTQFESHQKAGAPNFAALANPGDANHAAALQALQARMTARIQAHDQVQQQIYGVLTASQKTQLASILAAKQAKFAQHSAG
jgi:Spy/CpxP family protein refolding chaperone